MGDEQVIIPEKIPYPKAVWFIIGNEFCERFTFYGIRTVLSLFLKQELGFSEGTATSIYHTFIFLSYFSPLFGAILADSVVGKFITITALSIVYACGNVILSLAAIPHFLPQIPFTIIGLIVIGIGTGGIKPCVAAFGGEQFKIPEQSSKLQNFFSMFYFSINLGSLISTYLTPVLREEVHCFNQRTCYTLAFGVPAGLMVIAIIIFLVGKHWYIIKKSEGSVFLRVMRCICRALCVNCKQKRSYWLDKSDDKYPKEFIEGIQAAFHVMILFIPIPIFWALYDQQGSRWTFQATRMNGELGENYRIQPDQMQVVNPLLILAFIPIFDFGIYPLLGKIRLLRKPLQRMATGGFLAALAFIISAILESQLEPTYPVLPRAGEGQIRLYNPLLCEINFKSPELTSKDQASIPRLGKWEDLHVNVKESKEFQFQVLKSDCFDEIFLKNLTVYEKEATTYILAPPNRVLQFRKEELDKPESSEPMVRVIYVEIKKNPSQKDEEVKPKVLKFKNSKGSVVGQSITFDENTVTGVVVDLPTQRLDIFLNDEKIKSEIKFEQAGVYALMITKDPTGDYHFQTETTTSPNTVHILWMVPQFVIITMAEIMLSITGLKFAFTQAPLEMKSLLQAVWLLTVALGNIIVTIIANIEIFESQMYEFLLFAGLMILDMIIFSILAWWYKYRNYAEE